jgi:REP element-mobilizing transposase RayT
MRYFITFACYGAHLHGNEKGSVDRCHNLVGSRVVPPDSQRVRAELELMDQPQYALDTRSRTVVLHALEEVCLTRGWPLIAAHVRTNHVHVIVEAEIKPEAILNTFKSYSSRALNSLGRDEPARKRWARHGSTRWLWKDRNVRDAVRYVVEEQGEPMAVVVNDVP